MTISQLYAATGSDLARLDRSGEDAWQATQLMSDVSAQCVASDPAHRDRLYIGTFDDGLFRSLDGGKTIEPVGAGIKHHRIMSLSFGPAQPSGGKSAIFAGTEPSAVFRSDDDGASWRSLDALLELSSQPSWSFPPRPWTSHVRWLATHPTDANTLYAGIELGGVMVTRDSGQTWEDRKDESYFDCHALATHPIKPDRVYEAAGGGVAFSEDAGLTWRRVDDGLEYHYVWGLAVDSADPDLWYVSAASGARAAHRNQGDADARIYRKQGSENWQPITDSLPYMPYVLLTDPTTPDVVLSGFQDGTIWSSRNRGESWTPQTIHPSLSHIQSLAIGQATV